LNFPSGAADQTLIRSSGAGHSRCGARHVRGYRPPPCQRDCGDDPKTRLGRNVRRHLHKSEPARKVGWATKNDSIPIAYEIRAGGREFRVTAGVSMCGGFCATFVVIGLLCTLVTRRRMLEREALAERSGFETAFRCHEQNQRIRPKDQRTVVQVAGAFCRGRGLSITVAISEGF
jgi:hypothetical protein